MDPWSVSKRTTSSDHLPSVARVDRTLRTCSVAMRRRPRIFTVVIEEVSGLFIGDNKSTRFDLFIFNFLSDSQNNDDRCNTTTAVAFLLLLLFLLRSFFFFSFFLRLFLFYCRVASMLSSFLAYGCVYRSERFLHWLLSPPPHIRIIVR